MNRSNRSQLLRWAGQGDISREQLPAALALAGVTPTPERWLRFLDRLLLWSGVLALVTAVIFFFAFNWSEMGRYTKFALVEAAVVIALFCYWRLGAERLAGELSLLAAAILLGGLLALFGQVYQTGADTWQLFATWALLIVPWVVVGRFAALWLVWLALLNMALLLYFQVHGALLGVLFSTDLELLTLFAFNGVAVVVWESAAIRHEWLRGRWAVRLLALASGVTVTLSAIGTIFGWSGATGFATIVYPLWLALLYGVYRRRIPDLFMLAGGVLSLIVAVTAWLADLLLDSGAAGGFFIIAVAVIALSALAARWLRAVHREQGS